LTSSSFCPSFFCFNFSAFLSKVNFDKMCQAVCGVCGVFLKKYKAWLFGLLKTAS